MTNVMDDIDKFLILSDQQSHKMSTFVKLEPANVCSFFLMNNYIIQ